MFYKIAQTVPTLLGYFSRKLCSLELSKLTNLATLIVSQYSKLSTTESATSYLPKQIVLIHHKYRSHIFLILNGLTYFQRLDETSQGAVDVVQRVDFVFSELCGKQKSWDDLKLEKISHTIHFGLKHELVVDRWQPFARYYKAILIYVTKLFYYML